MLNMTGSGYVWLVGEREISGNALRYAPDGESSTSASARARAAGQAPGGAGASGLARALSLAAPARPPARRHHRAAAHQRQERVGAHQRRGGRGGAGGARAAGEGEHHRPAAGLRGQHQHLEDRAALQEVLATAAPGGAGPGRWVGPCGRGRSQNGGHARVGVGGACRVGQGIAVGLTYGVGGSRRWAGPYGHRWVRVVGGAKCLCGRGQVNGQGQMVERPANSKQGGFWARVRGARLGRARWAGLGVANRAGLVKGHRGRTGGSAGQGRRWSGPRWSLAGSSSLGLSRAR